MQTLPTLGAKGTAQNGRFRGALTLDLYGPGGSEKRQQGRKSYHKSQKTLQAAAACDNEGHKIKFAETKRGL